MSSFPPIDVEKGYEVAELVVKIRSIHQAYPSQIAIASLMQRSFVSSIIVGLKGLQQLDENLGAVYIVLSDPEMKA